MEKAGTDRRVVRSKLALKEALLSLMERKSFSSVTITEIVELANYNRGTFYAHYGSKEDLLGEVIDELIEELLEAFRAPYEQVDIFRIDELTADSVKIFDYIYERADVYTVLFKSDVLPLIKEKMFQAIKKIAQEDLEHPDVPLNRELMNVYSMHALMGLVFHWIEGGFAHSPAYMKDQLIKMLQWKPTTAMTHRRRK